MPHSITTRYHQIISLRALLDEAGKRLCTQAQFGWRVVLAQVVNEIRSYRAAATHGILSEKGKQFAAPDWWQFEAIADLLRPVCYAEGKCGFMASMDRGCTIRSRVDAFAKEGVPSSEWGRDHMCHTPPCGHPEVELHQIRTAEWALDPGAARVAP